MMPSYIAFKKVNEPYGWLGNMSPHPIRVDTEIYHTAEHLFQCLRFGKQLDIRNEIMKPKSPMAAKMTAEPYTNQMVVTPRSIEDVENIELVLLTKLVQHPILIDSLNATGDAFLIEDVSSHMSESSLYWGMALVKGKWVGQNILGNLWMKIRLNNRL